MFFRLSSLELGLIILGVITASTLVGLAVGSYLRRHKESLREPLGVVQAALLGLVGLILAFGLTLAVGRYEQRRAAVVDEANAIGTTYLRAQTLAEPQRSWSLALLRTYTDTTISLSREVPGGSAARTTVATSSALQRRLWRLAGEALAKAPLASAPRLYVDSLNSTFDTQRTRIASRNNRVPGSVLALELLGASAALALLALFLAILGRGLITALLAAGLVTLLLLVTFDLDRPTRGLIRIPNTPLVSVRASMALPPAASGPLNP